MVPSARQLGTSDVSLRALSRARNSESVTMPERPDRLLSPLAEDVGNTCSSSPAHRERKGQKAPQHLGMLPMPAENSSMVTMKSLSVS